MAAGRQCILAVMHEFRHLKASFAGAWDSVRSREALEPVSLRVPVPPLVLNAIVAFAFLRGFTSTTVTAARDWISMAVGCLISFDGLLQARGMVCTLPPFSRRASASLPRDYLYSPVHYT